MLERKFTKIGGQLVNGPKSEFRSPPPPMYQHERADTKLIYPITKKSDLHDRFNESLFNSLFLVLDECLFAGNHEQANELKAVISESTGTKDHRICMSFFDWKLLSSSR